MRLAAKGHADHLARVGPLLGACRPPAVHPPVVRVALQAPTASVAHVVVDPLQRMLLRWLRTNVAEEGIERILPPGAHDQPATAVAVVVFVSRPEAAALCFAPRPVLACVGAAVAFGRRE